MLNVQKNTLPYFGLNAQYTKLNAAPAGCARSDFNHTTHFFRNKEMLEFMAAYVQKFFSEGTHIADYGCSNGSETRSIAMLLSDFNENKKYTVTGYEISESMIEEAKDGYYEFERRINPSNFVLIDSKFDRNNENDKYRTLFNKFFKCRKRIGDEEFLFEAQNELFNGVVDFKKGNITEISKEGLNRKKTGVVVFKNAWYHLDNAAKENTAVAIYNLLPDYGLLMVGCHGIDHKDNSLKKALQKAKFSPVRYEQVELSYNPDNQVPSVWAKIPEGRENQVKRAVEKLVPAKRNRFLFI